MNVQQVVKRLQDLAEPDKITLKQQRFGIYARNSLGIYHRDLKIIAKEIGRDDALALALYDTGIYEARLLCSKIYRPESITKSQMNRWVKDFENWEVCDSFCMGFFVNSEYALEKAALWSQAEGEFVKRAGFVIMAAYGFAHKNDDNGLFEGFFAAIEREAEDPRIYVKKAVNWALRNIGKRNVDLQHQAKAVAEGLALRPDKSAQWIGNNALAELNKPSVNVMDYPRSVYRPS